MRRFLLAAALTFVAVTAFGQTLTIGNTPANVNSSTINLGAVATFVDLNNPATASGLIGSVTFRWSQFPCTNEVKIKTFHQSGNTLVYKGQAGPFSVTTFSMTVTIPGLGLAVNEGDLIGITQLQACG